ncbi:MAG: hypothetical protein E7470_08225 [Ruminococcaceae bacterium]|nr:hypothetical protein [Oscillospiraceae bacterium]
MNKFSPDNCHENALRNMKPLLKFDESAPFEPWRAAVKEKLTELLGDMPQRVPLNLQIEWEKEHDTFIEKRIVFDSEEDTSVPCHLWIPKNAKLPCPVIICLQGHSSGMHISMGRTIYPGDAVGGDRDFAVQIVNEGYAALVLEQRAFGERYTEKSLVSEDAPDLRKEQMKLRTSCFYPSLNALLLGRTLIGERVWDVSRAIDAIEQIPELDSDRVACMGNSGGGTATYYAACMDERIKIAIPSCAVCTFIESIGIKRHCSCNYIPNIAKYFDMGELAACIAPRKLIVVSGEQDDGFYIKGARDAYSVIEKIYDKAGCPDNCKQVIGPLGHRFYAEPTWDVFAEMSGWKE